MGRENNSRNINAGLSLIELIIALSIISILLVGTIATLDPITQINKGKDAQKRQDLIALKDAFDLFYHDTNCYPQAAEISVPAFKNYIKKLPDNYATDYTYLPEDFPNPVVACPQWYVLKAKKSYTKDTDFCQIKTIVDPTKFCLANTKDYLCIFGGNFDCVEGTL